MAEDLLNCRDQDPLSTLLRVCDHDTLGMLRTCMRVCVKTPWGCYAPNMSDHFRCWAWDGWRLGQVRLVTGRGLVGFYVSHWPLLVGVSRATIFLRGRRAVP